MNGKNNDNLELAMAEALLKSYEAVSRERYPEETSRWFHIDKALEYWFKGTEYVENKDATPPSPRPKPSIIQKVKEVFGYKR